MSGYEMSAHGSRPSADISRCPPFDPTREWENSLARALLSRESRSPRRYAPEFGELPGLRINLDRSGMLLDDNIVAQRDRALFLRRLALS
jgi:hypothetical protein